MKDIIQTWGSDDRIILCTRTQARYGTVKCELCSHRIAALPESAQKADQKNWHLVCHECFRQFLPELQLHGGGVKFEGRFRTSEEAKKILK